MSVDVEPVDRFGGLIERGDGVEFPFYAGEPVMVGGLMWLRLWLSTVAAFLLLDACPFGDGHGWS